MADAGSNLIVALDYDSPEAALNLAKRLDPATVRLKVGKQLFTLAGPDMVRSLQNLGFDIFLDLKFHDIPTTVAKAVKAAAELGVWMVNVHASGGSRMMRAAREALNDLSRPPLLVGVTVLTSMDRDGTRDGFELVITRAITDAVDIPVIASGGVGTLQHLADGVTEGGADAVLAASIFHFGEYTVGEAKSFMADRGITMRV